MTARLPPWKELRLRRVPIFQNWNLVQYPFAVNDVLAALEFSQKENFTVSLQLYFTLFRLAISVF